uniref:Rac GTPase-activating protein 1 n=1 Tax=Parastrongyloides trichosuri TaxID=131310 RepID=A0A0N5A4V0_PARTI
MDLSRSIRILEKSKQLFAEAEEMMMGGDNANLTIAETVRELLLRCRDSEDRIGQLEKELKEKNEKEKKLLEEINLKDSQLVISRTQIGALHAEKMKLETSNKRLMDAMALLRAATSGDICPDAFAILSESDLKQPRKSRKSRDSDNFDDSNMFDKTGDSSDDILPVNNGYRNRNSYTNGARKRSLSSSQAQQTGQQYKKPAYDDISSRPNVGNNQNLGIIKESPTDKTPVLRRKDMPVNNQRVEVIMPQRPKLRRSLSETQIFSKKAAEMYSNQIGTGNIDARSIASIDSCSSTNAWGDLNTIPNRRHTFEKGSLAMGYCDCCKGFVIRCKTMSKCADCGIVCHPTCIDKAPIPCVPRNAPLKTGSKTKHSLAEMCTRRSPMIPHTIVHCVVALEKFYLTTEGLYRVPGSDAEVVRLLHAFLYDKAIPSFKDVEAETIAGCLKKFLRDLRDPLIPTSSYNEFVKAVRERDTDALTYAIMDLPQPNLHTLAYLCLHWQKVAENSYQNKMPLDNIATVIGPTIVGYSKNPKLLTSQQIGHETETQFNVMLALLNLPECFWSQFLQKKSIDPTIGSKTPIGAMNTLKRNQIYQRTMCSLRDHHDNTVSYETNYQPDQSQAITPGGDGNRTIFDSMLHTPPRDYTTQHLSPRTIKRNLIKRDFINEKYY